MVLLKREKSGCFIAFVLGKLNRISTWAPASELCFPLRRGVESLDSLKLWIILGTVGITMNRYRPALWGIIVSASSRVLFNQLVSKCLTNKKNLTGPICSWKKYRNTDKLLFSVVWWNQELAGGNRSPRDKEGPCVKAEQRLWCSVTLLGFVMSLLLWKPRWGGCCMKWVLQPVLPPLKLLRRNWYVYRW